MTDEKPDEDKNGETLKRFDMYRFFSRKDVILAIILTVAFLIFSVAIRFLSQPV